MNKLLFLSLSLIAASLQAEPPHKIIDGVDYIIDGNTAIATSPMDESAKSAQDIIIRQSVEYDGTEYPVSQFWGYCVAYDGQRIYLPEGITTIQGESFGARIDALPSSIENIMSGSLREVTLPADLYLPNIRILGPNALNATGVTTLRLGPSLKLLGTDAFNTAMTKVEFDCSDGNEPLDLGWNSLNHFPGQELLLPKRNQLKISDCVMEYSDNIERILFPDIAEIEYGGADAYNYLANVIELNGCFFRECPNLREIVCLGAEPIEITNTDLIFSYPVSNATEFNIVDKPENIILKVPAGSETLYRSHPLWGKFKTIYGFENGDYTAIETIICEPTESECTYYNLQGIKVACPVKGQLYIRDSGRSIEKIVY